MANKQVVLFLRGLPASGKSTFAKQLVEQEPERWVRVNKDTLRDLFHDGKWSRGRENLVRKMELSLAESALKEGHSVIVDNTNIIDKHVPAFQELADKYGAEFMEKWFTDVPVEDCIARDLKRPRPVGKDVILGMFYQMCPKEQPYREGLPSAIISDIDGTVAKMNGRGPYEWDKVGSDSLILPTSWAIEAIQVAHKCALLFVSGRDSACRKETEEWLEDHGFTYSALHMRPEGVREKDSIAKLRMYNEHIKDKYNVLAVFDDRPQVIRLWRSLGLFVFDCGNGVEF